MILGIGNDLIDIRRIEKLLKAQGTRFENRVFTQGEQKMAKSRKRNQAATYAKRFAAKEACVKALRETQGIGWQDIEVVNEKTGAPTLKLHGAAEKRLRKLTPKGMKTRLLLALTDEYPYAFAQVMIVADHA
jgi:holo-[acyl-carrier protein] synthase